MRNHPFSRRSLQVLTLVLVAASISCSAPAPQQSSSVDTASATSGPHVPIGQLPDIDTTAVLAHTKMLSSDEFEGRLPGSNGEEKTVGYLIDQFKKAGLRPCNPDGTYVQKVPLVGITPAPAPLVVKKGG